MDPYAEIVAIVPELGDVIADQGAQRTKTIEVKVSYGTTCMPMRFHFDPPLAGHLPPQDIVADEFRKMADALRYLETDDGRKQIRSQRQP